MTRYFMISEISRKFRAVDPNANSGNANSLVYQVTSQATSATF